MVMKRRNILIKREFELRLGIQEIFSNSKKKYARTFIPEIEILFISVRILKEPIQFDHQRIVNCGVLHLTI